MTPLTSKAFKNLVATTVQAQPAVAPHCPHVGQCGGCAFQDRAYADQVAAKQQVLQTLWADLAPPNANADAPPAEPNTTAFPAVVPSPDPYAYRTRMDYVTTRGRFGLRMRGRFNYIIELTTCHLIPPAAFRVALTLWERAQALEMPDYNMRSHEGFLRYIVIRRSPRNRLLLAMVTAGEQYPTEMEQLAACALAHPEVVGFHWLLNDTLTDLSFGRSIRHWGAATLPMEMGPQTLHIGPNSFFQNNIHLLRPLLDAVAVAVGPAQRVADLYSGVGAIALHLAGQVEHLLAVESHPESAALGRYNIALNGATNVTMHAADVADFLASTAPGSLDTIVADPPRTGLGAQICAELLRLQPRRIVYVSCNPLTQREDVLLLQAGYQLTALRGYDMFPHTPHVEALAVLDRRAPTTHPLDLDG